MLDDFGLIHMNGRVYDPVLARFTSADPLVKDPTDAGSFNRYSYCHNEPMRLTDPTGFDDVSSGSDSPWFLDWGDGGGSGNYGWSPTYGVDSSGGGTVGNWSITSGWSYSQNSYWAKSPDTYNLSIGSSSSGGSSMDAGSLINFGSVGTSFQSGTVGSAPGLPAFGFNGFTLPDVPRWINPDGTFNPNASVPNSEAASGSKGDALDKAGRVIGALGATAGTVENVQNGAMGFWVGKNWSFLRASWGGNGATGGRLIFAGKMAGYAKTGGNILGGLGIGVSGLQGYDAFQKNDANGMVQAGADITVGVIGFAGPVGWAGATGYFGGQQLDRWFGITDTVAKVVTADPPPITPLLALSPFE
jgi:RHS repeat-associated protein